ncbi:MAG: DUF2243 domain-containing protein [Opitutaceae bacterium]|jgi:uncharacterized membrane protein
MTLPPLNRAGIVLGIGLGGLFDGIVLHQILGWHHMVCLTETCQPDSLQAVKLQTMQDGFFDLAVLLITLAGIVLMFRATRQQPTLWSPKVFLGAVLGGWGVFNFAEGLVDHQILGLHHVLPGSPHSFLFDMLFLASGLLFAGVGWKMARRVG